MNNNFNLKKFLAEGKLLEEERFYAPNYVKQKYGNKASEIENNIHDEEDNNPNIWDLYTSLESPEEVDDFVQGFINESELNENEGVDEIPLTPDVKTYIDSTIQSAKEDGELEYLVDVGFFDTDIIDNILVEFIDEFPNADDVNQEVKDYIDSQL
jgi:hypothetical protein